MLKNGAGAYFEDCYIKQGCMFTLKLFRQKDRKGRCSLKGYLKEYFYLLFFLPTLYTRYSKKMLMCAVASS